MAGEMARAGPCGGGGKGAVGRGEGRQVSASSPVTPIRLIRADSLEDERERID